MSDPAPLIVQEYGGKLNIRCRRPYPQEFQISLLEAPALIAEIVKAVPYDAHGAALIDQMIAAARARRPHDRTNAERQRRFRQRRRAQRQRCFDNAVNGSVTR
jgi:hypothetical protein